MGKNNPRERKAAATGSHPEVAPAAPAAVPGAAGGAAGTPGTPTAAAPTSGAIETDVATPTTSASANTPASTPVTVPVNTPVSTNADLLPDDLFATSPANPDDAGADVGSIADDTLDNSESILGTLRERKPSDRQLKRQAKAQEAMKRAKGARIAKNIGLGFLVTVLVAFVIALCSFCIFRWQTFNDAADIQGMWYYKNSETSIEFTPDKIVLTSDVAYTYVLDPEAKTIMYTFGYMSGQGRYRFSLDRTQLSISDGSFEFWGTFIDDAIWTVQSLFSQWFGTQTPPLGSNADSIVLVRDKADLSSATAGALTDGSGDAGAHVGTDAASSSSSSSSSSSASNGADAGSTSGDNQGGGASSDDASQEAGNAGSQGGSSGSGSDLKLPVNDLPRE